MFWMKTPDSCGAAAEALEVSCEEGPPAQPTNTHNEIREDKREDIFMVRYRI
jgi:hypothetical protein